jgi:basic membrane protein A
MIRAKKQFLARAVTLVGSVALLAGCGMFSNASPPNPDRNASPTGGMNISEQTATPVPTPQFVKSVLLVAHLGEASDATPAGLSWSGVKTAAAKIEATATHIELASNAELAADLERAATPSAALVVTVGTDASAAVAKAAAKAHPATQFLELDVTVDDSAPANVHGIVFDQAEAGYLAGYVAATFAAGGRVGIVGDTAADVASANYAAGLKAGAVQADSSAEVTIAYAGTADSPAKGRTAAGVLAKAGDRVVAAVPSLSGIGALRQACGAGLQLVGLDIDVWQNVPDVQSCVIASVVKRYDVAAASAISAIASGKTLPRLSTGTVGSGGVALSDFHVDLPAGFKAKLDAVVGALSNRPAPPTTPAAGSPLPSPGT